MIEVRINKIKSAKDDLDSDLKNDGAEVIANDLRSQLKNVKCDNHPDKKSILTITPITPTNFKFDKSGFCCKEFADSIKVKSE